MKKRSLLDFIGVGGGSRDANLTMKKQIEVVLRPPDLSSICPPHFLQQKHLFSDVKAKDECLLVDIVRPKTLSSILGHHDAKKAVLNYLSSPESRAKPALLLSGPTGCGKTLLASLAISESNYQLWDDRVLDLSKDSEDSIAASLDSLSRRKSLSGKPWCGLIECIEGLAPDEKTALLKSIKTTKTAVILTCDDAFEPSNKSFRENCIHVRMSQNDSNTILRILFKAGEVYGLKLSPETASSLLTNSNQNVRLALNTLQLLATTKRTARKGAPLSAADETFNVFTSCSQLCAATPKSFEKALVISSGDSDMFVSLLHQNCVSSSSFPLMKTSLNLANVFDTFSASDVFLKRFFMDEGTFMTTLSIKINLCVEKPEKQASFPLCYSIMSSLKSRKDRLPLAAGSLSELFLGEERPLYDSNSRLNLKLKSRKEDSSKTTGKKAEIKDFVRDISPQSNLLLLSQVRPSGLDAHDTLVVLKSRVNGRGGAEFRSLKKEGLFVTGDAQANEWIQKGVFKV